MDHQNKKHLNSAVAMKNLSLTNGGPVNDSKVLQSAMNGHKNQMKTGEDLSEPHEVSNQRDTTCNFDPSPVEVGRKSGIVCQKSSSIQPPRRTTSSSKCDSESKTQCARLEVKDAKLSEPSGTLAEEDDDLPKRLEMRVSTGWTGPGLATTTIFFFFLVKQVKPGFTNNQPRLFYQPL